MPKKQKEIIEKHPVLSQLTINVLSGVISGLIVAFLVAWWGLTVIPPKPKANSIPTSKSSSEVIIQNFGYMPASTEYTIASPPTVTTSFSITSGEKYGKIIDTEKKNEKKVIVRELPKSEKIEINIIGSNNVTINNN